MGTVVAGPAEWMERRAVGEINFSCERCPTCARGLKRHCPRRRVMGILEAPGAFAEFVEVPISNLHAVPESVSDEEAVFVEPLAAAFEILEQVHVCPGTTCNVLGDGKLGLLVAQVLDAAGARVRVIGRHADKLAIARRRGIATESFDAWDRRPAELVVDATGTAAGFALAAAATTPRGTLVLKSTVAESGVLNLAPLVIDEITVVGSRCGNFAPALRALECGTIDVRSLISERYALAAAPAALERAAASGVLKVLIHP